MNINGLELPAALAANLRDGCNCLSDQQTARFKAMLTQLRSPEPELYDYENIIWENEDPWTSSDIYYLGNSSEQYAPGNIDPERVVIIGNGDQDCPIALDYRTVEPRVIYFCDIDEESYWVELGPTYEALMKAIGPA